MCHECARLNSVYKKRVAEYQDALNMARSAAQEDLATLTTKIELLHLASWHVAKILDEHWHQAHNSAEETFLSEN